jgi:hypothetical protein
MSCNIGSCNHGLQALCIPPVEFSPPTIQCPTLNTSEQQNPLCDLLPEITDIADFLVNLPFLILYTVSLPARFLYCLAYQFLLNGNTIVDFFLYYIINPTIDILTAPFLYFALGFNNGLNDTFAFPNQLYGFLNACLVSFLSTLYSIIGDVTYTVGFAIGFILSLIIKFFNLLIDIPCYLAFLQICIGVSICVGFTVAGVTVGLSGCYTACFYPFGFLQGLICTFLNCACSLGSCPTISLILPISLGCNAPNCTGSSSQPNCTAQHYGLTNSEISVPPISISSEFSEYYSSESETSD